MVETFYLFFTQNGKPETKSDILINSRKGRITAQPKILIDIQPFIL